jgi:hypothetical protein
VSLIQVSVCFFDAGLISDMLSSWTKAVTVIQHNIQFMAYTTQTEERNVSSPPKLGTD